MILSSLLATASACGSGGGLSPYDDDVLDEEGVGGAGGEGGWGGVGGEGGDGGWGGAGGDGGGGSGGTGGRGARLTIQPGRRDFGSASIGEATEPHLFAITNVGSGAAGRMEVRFDGPGARSFVVESTTCGALDPGDICLATVQFRPAAKGEQLANLVVTGGGSSASVPLRGFAIAPARLVFRPDSVDFGRVPLQRTESRWLELVNDGDTATGAINISLGPTMGATFRIVEHSCRAVLQPQASCKVQVSFTPHAAVFAGSAIEASAKPGGAALAKLSGQGHELPRLTATPSFHEFGRINVGETSEIAGFTIRNAGRSRVSTVSVSFNGDFSGSFMNPLNTCTAGLDPGAVCFVVLRFRPTRPGPLLAEAVVGGMDSIPASVKLSGFGVGDVVDPFGPIGYWKMDDAVGNLVKDSSGNNNAGSVVAGSAVPGSLVDAPVWGVGKSGTALQLGGDQWVRVPTSQSLNNIGTNNAFTISMWVFVDSYDPAPDAIHWFASRHEVQTAFKHFGIGLRGGRLMGEVHFSPSIGREPLPQKQWVHVAAAYDGITLSLYQNGIALDPFDIGWPIAPDETPVVFGSGIAIDRATGFFSGSLDEVRLYDRALTPMEIAVLAK